MNEAMPDGGAQGAGEWLNRHLVADAIARGADVEIRFPMAVSTETYRHMDVDYTCCFKGSTALSVTPPTSVTARAGE